MIFADVNKIFAFFVLFLLLIKTPTSYEHSYWVWAISLSLKRNLWPYMPDLWILGKSWSAEVLVCKIHAMKKIKMANITFLKPETYVYLLV